MNRYLVFEFDTYYPCGGWDDLHSTHQTIESAKATVESKGFQNWQIVDTETREIIRSHD